MCRREVKSGLASIRNMGPSGRKGTSSGSLDCLLRSEKVAGVPGGLWVLPSSQALGV